VQSVNDIKIINFLQLFLGFLFLTAFPTAENNTALFSNN
jgi:hypothetical protein